jgi:hypothetical protein
MEEQDWRRALIDLAQEQGLSAEDLERDALAFYTKFPLAARRVLRALMVLGTDSEIEVAVQEAGNVLVRHAFAIALQRGSEAAKGAYPDVELATEEAEIEEAVRQQKAADLPWS